MASYRTRRPSDLPARPRPAEHETILARIGRRYDDLTERLAALEAELDVERFRAAWRDEGLPLSAETDPPDSPPPRRRAK